MPVGVAQGINATAILLLVEILALADLDHAGGSTTLAPVVIPVSHPRITRRGANAAIVDLLHVLPARNAQRTGDHRKAMLVGVQRGTLKTHIETHGATNAAFGRVFHALGACKPIVAI